MKGLNKEELEEWKKKRSKTLIGYMIIACVCAIDYSIIFATLYLYLTTVIKTNNPNFYYGLIFAMFNISSTAAAIISGRILDITRKIKYYTYIILCLQIIGNVFYILHFSPIYPMIGRLLAGAADSSSSIYCSEIVRLYNVKEGTSNLWKIASAYSIGMVVGPAFGVVFKGVAFNIGPIYINYTNFCGIVIIGATFLCFIVNYFLLYDCSLEFDMKQHLSSFTKIKQCELLESCNTKFSDGLDERKIIAKEDKDTITSEIEKILKVETNNEIESTSKQVTNEKEADEVPDCGEHIYEQADNSNEVTSFYIMKTFLHNPDIMLIMVSTFVFMYFLFSSDLLLPLLVMKTLKWNFDTLVIILCVYAAAYFIVVVIASKYCTSDKAVYNMTIFCIICNVACFIVIAFMALLNRNTTQDIILMACFLVSFLFVWFLDDVLMRNFLANMVPSNVQSFAEATRNSCSKFGTIFSALTASVALPVIQYWCYGMIAIAFLFLVIFLMKRKSLLNIKQIKL